MLPEELVQTHVASHEGSKVRALFSVGVPTLFLGAPPGTRVLSAAGMLLVLDLMGRRARDLLGRGSKWKSRFPLWRLGGGTPGIQ